MTYPAASGSVEARREVGCEVGPGELVALVGPSGGGKSTLLRIIAGLRPPTRGAVSVAGRPVTRPLPAVGMVFQAPVLLKGRRIVDTVLLAAELAGLAPARRRARAEALLSLVGLGEFGAKRPRELSGGMQQRVALCRALLLDPPLLLMDEPFGALDALTRDELNLELLRVWGEGSHERKTIVFVTHSIPEAVFLADRVVVLTARPGRVAASIAVGLARRRTVASRASAAVGALPPGALDRGVALVVQDAAVEAVDQHEAARPGGELRGGLVEHTRAPEDAELGEHRHRHARAHAVDDVRGEQGVLVEHLR